MSRREYTRFYVLLTPENPHQRTELRLFVASFDLRTHLRVPATTLLIEATLIKKRHHMKAFDSRRARPPRN